LKELEEYKEFLKRKGLREKSIKAYLFDINLFFRFSLGGITNKLLEDYRDKKLNNDNHRTANRAISSINGFIDFLNDINFITILKRLKLFDWDLKHNNCSLNSIEIKNVYDKLTLNVNKERDILMLKLFEDTGMRSGEIIHIKKCDINLLNNTCFLSNCKGGLMRTVYFSNQLKEALSIYLKNFQDNDYIFQSQKGGAMSQRAVQHVLGKCKINSNMLRHTRATSDTKEAFGIIKKCSFQLGHNSVSTTKLYCDV
jgi:site-specific recombinase XerD